MKKLLSYSLVVFSSLFLISEVKAATVDAFSLDYYESSSSSCPYVFTNLSKLLKSEWIYDNYIFYLNSVKDKYNELYVSEFPYYFIAFEVDYANNKSCPVDNLPRPYAFDVSLFYFSSIPSVNVDFSSNSYLTLGSLHSVTLHVVFNEGNETPVLYYGDNELFTSYSFFGGSYLDNNKYLKNMIYESNFDLIYSGNDVFNVYDNVDKSNLIYTISNGYKFPTYTTSSSFEDSYVTVNLNDYSYVLLSLKDYNQEAFNSVVQVKGQYCLTSVYNYGMTERKEILDGSKMERCSVYYDNFTPVRTYILDSDLKNHAVYYLKAYDTSKDNIVKIDTSVFDVTTISEADKDNPYVTIGGRTYPVIPYDQLTDTATKSEDEGYSSGSSEQFGFTFSDIFSSPLEFLKNIWSSVTNVFTLIGYFISILPEPLQYFLYTSFMLAVVLGLIKIIL